MVCVGFVVGVGKCVDVMWVGGVVVFLVIGFVFVSCIFFIVERELFVWFFVDLVLSNVVELIVMVGLFIIVVGVF